MARKQSLARRNPKPYLMEISLRRDEIESFDQHPFSVPAIRKLDSLEFHPDVTFFIGENGSGKSTLLEAIAGALGLNPGGGNKNSLFATPENSFSPLYSKITASRGAVKPSDYYFLRAESFFNVASYIDEMDKDPFGGPRIIDSYGGVSLHEQSHGESFMALLLNKLRGNGLYLFDEPEAALSPKRQIAALAAIDQLVKQKSQFIIATHSPILLSYPNARILTFDTEKIEPVSYEECDPTRSPKIFFGTTSAAFKWRSLTKTKCPI